MSEELGDTPSSRVYLRSSADANAWVRDVLKSLGHDNFIRVPTVLQEPVPEPDEEEEEDDEEN